MEKVKIVFVSLIFVGVWSGFTGSAWAQNAKVTKAEAAPTAKSKEQVLDFEGEVIEGERRRPDLFLQMSIEQVKFDSLIFQRDDFNDYLEVDRKSRSRYLRYK